MSQAPVITVPAFDPGQLLTTGRLLCGAPFLRDVVLDQNFGAYGRWIWVGTTGNISYVAWDGTTCTAPNASGGVMHPIYALKINTSGTSATGLRWGS